MKPAASENQSLATRIFGESAFVTIGFILLIVLLG